MLNFLYLVSVSSTSSKLYPSNDYATVARHVLVHHLRTVNPPVGVLTLLWVISCCHLHWVFVL